MLRLGRWRSTSFVILAIGLLGAAADETGKGRLKHVEAAPRDDLDGVVSVSISPDGGFLYAASWKPSALTVFARDPKSGRLAHKRTISDEDVVGGATALSLSPNGRFAVSTGFKSRAAVLYERDAETGELSKVDVARDGEKEVRFQWPIDAAFSPDSKHLYVIDDHGPGEGGHGAVVAFRVNDDKLELIGTDEGRDGCYQGVRGLAFHPDGKTLFVAASDAGTLVVIDRDETTGKTKVRQIVKDEEGDVHSLAGAMGVAVSPDGRSVYVSSGRFHGDSAVSAFQIATDGRVALFQEFRNGEGDLKGFDGGNEIAVSSDGLNVYAVATRSGTVAAFRRDPATGKLTALETLPDGGGEGGESGAAGIGVSPDGRFVYVATEDHKAVSVFQRDAAK